VPEKTYAPKYGAHRDMAEAWELIGATLVPTASQKKRTHAAIETTLQAGLPPDLYLCRSNRSAIRPLRDLAAEILD
jgi:hypothetical protein